jgi:hypothetical protein
MTSIARAVAQVRLGSANIRERDREADRAAARWLCSLSWRTRSAINPR